MKILSRDEYQAVVDAIAFHHEHLGEEVDRGSMIAEDVDPMIEAGNVALGKLIVHVEM
jgi:Ser-tRNA(Ala) deacylase AlaX